MLYPAIRLSLAVVPAWVGSLADIAVICLPLFVAVVAAGRFTSSRGFAGSVGVRGWRPTDVLFGIGVGLIVRAVVEVMAPTAGSLSNPLAEGGDGLATVIVIVIGAVAVSPLVEELFFRGLVVRALAGALIYTGRRTAAVVAVLVSTAAFVALHILPAGDSVPIALVVATAGLGVGCAVLAVVMGRLASAVVAHVVFNGIGVALLIW